MSEVVISKFDISRLSKSAIKLLKSTVRYAEGNQQSTFHKISMNELCDQADLPGLSSADFLNLVREMLYAKAIVETIDPYVIEREDLPFSCWSVFEQIEFDSADLSFHVSKIVFDAALMERLHDLS